MEELCKPLFLSVAEKFEREVKFVGLFPTNVGVAGFQFADDGRDLSFDFRRNFDGDEEAEGFVHRCAACCTSCDHLPNGSVKVLPGQILCKKILSTAVRINNSD
jgi:hypothetical protein